jgi:dTDP-4-dehydrorhamnose 3,5-epimerase
LGELVIDGVLVTPLKKILNPKGDIFHAMNVSSDGYVGFGEAYFSTIHQGQIKGWKRHLRATLNLVVIVGRIKFVVFDGDPHAKDKSRNVFFEIVLGRENYVRLTVQSGLWVAFQGVNEGTNILLNISSEEHDPLETENTNLSNNFYEW